MSLFQTSIGEFFVSGETGQPLMDQGIQSDDTRSFPILSRSSNVGTLPEGEQDSPESVQLQPTTPTLVSDSAVTDSTSQFNSTQTRPSEQSGKISQATDFHSSVETVDYGPESAKDLPMEDEDAADDDSVEDNVGTLIKMEPSEDLDHIPAVPASSESTADVDLKLEPLSGSDNEDDSGSDDDFGQDMEDFEMTSPSPTTPVTLSENLDAPSGAAPSGNQQGSHRHHQGASSNKPYQCGVCSKSFRSIQVLQKHSQTVHRHGQSKGRGLQKKQSRSRGVGSSWKQGGKQQRTHVPAASLP